MKHLTIILMLAALTARSDAQAVLKPDAAESKVHFTIKNFALNVGGDFSGLKGSIKFNPAQVAATEIDLSVDAKSIDTKNETRDNHLRKEEYFDVEKFPELQFKGTKVSAYEGMYFAEGRITIKGVTKTISFPFQAVPQNGGWLFQCLFELNRRDFNVGGSSAVMSDNLKVTLTIFAK